MDISKIHMNNNNLYIHIVKVIKELTRLININLETQGFSKGNCRLHIIIIENKPLIKYSIPSPNNNNNTLSAILIILPTDCNKLIVI